MIEYPQLTPNEYKGPKATLHTNYGDIEVILFPTQAPKAVENFLTHAKDGYYDGIIFHRVINDFMIQGGDPTGTGFNGESIWGHNFEDEFSDDLFNINGALSMANGGPMTNGSQFFIVQNQHMEPAFASQLAGAGYPQQIIDAYVNNGGTPWLDHRHTVFGQVANGMDIVNKIALVKTDSADKPLEDVVIESITVVD
jgi:peptidyl-prolyl cis-trans isomerase B (cyclophilin B)